MKQRIILNPSTEEGYVNEINVNISKQTNQASHEIHGLPRKNHKYFPNVYLFKLYLYKLLNDTGYQ